MIATLLLFLRLTIALFLLFFLGWALLILWKDFKREAESRSERLFPAITLRHISQDGLREHQFNVPEILIGRNAGCDLHLNDVTVSAEHARLTYHNNQWWVEDLGSKNGTYLNNEAVMNAVVLKSGDELQLGQVTLAIEISERI